MNPETSVVYNTIFKANDAELAAFITLFNLTLGAAVKSGGYKLDSPEGLAAINAEVTQQTTTLAYLQDFRLMTWITLVALPLLRR